MATANSPELPAVTRAGPQTADWWIAGLFCGNLILTTLCLGGALPSLPLVCTWGLHGAALALLLGRKAALGERFHPAALWLLPFLVYAALNVTLVSPVPWLGWRDWLTWVNLVASFWLALDVMRYRGPRILLLVTVVALAVLAVVVAAFQRYVQPDLLMMERTQVPHFVGRSSGTFGVPTHLAGFLVLVIPPMLALTWQPGASALQRIGCGYLAAVLLFGLGLTISRGAWLSLILALTCWPLFNRKAAWSTRLALALGAFILASVATAVVYHNAPRVKARFEALVRDQGERSRPIMWKGAWQLFLDAPVVGTGAGSYNLLFERHRPEGFRDEPLWAHNDYLNTLSDYGLIGFVLFFGAAGWILVRALRQPRRPLFEEPVTGWETSGVGAGIVVGLVAFAASLFIDFYFKLPALAMIMSVACAEVLRRVWPEPVAGRPTVWARGSFAVGALLALIFVGAWPARMIWAERARLEGREEIDALARRTIAPEAKDLKPVLERAAGHFSSALAFDANNAQAWADRAYGIALWARLTPKQSIEAGKQAEVAARQALVLCDVSPEFWVRLGVALDLQGRIAEGEKAFVKAVQLAPHNPDPWYYYAYHLSLKRSSLPLARAAIDTCLHLDPTHASAIALRENLSRTL